MRITISVMAGLILVTIALISSAQTSVPFKLNVQALVRDSDDNPVSTSYEGAEVSLWSAEVGGAKLWSDTLNVTINQGLLNMILEIENNIFRETPDAWLEIEFDGNLKLVRRQIVSVAYSYHAESANVANHAARATNANQAASCNNATHARSCDNAANAGHATACDSASIASDVSFNYAGSTTKGGAASDLSCSNCVTDGEVVNSLTLDYIYPGLSDTGIYYTRMWHPACGNYGFFMYNYNNPSYGDSDSFVISSLQNKNLVLGSGSGKIVLISNGGVYTRVNGVTTLKTFVIDHPGDESKYLVHSTLEGPEGAVYYRGEAQLEEGEVEVVLPHYFEALTRKEDRTVLLTNVGGFDPIAVKRVDGDLINDGKFTVISSNPASSQEFIWEVKAVRADVKPLTVEPDKDNIDVRGDGPYRYIYE